MRLQFLLTFLIISVIHLSQAQDQAATHINKGIALHDSGQYTEAIKEYKEALKISPDSPWANYEMASSYFANGDYSNAIKCADAVIKIKAEFVDQAYILKGSAQDTQKKTADAIKTYKTGIKSYPDSYLLHFNLALTYYNSNDIDNAEKSLINALKCNPEHSSSHLLIAYIQSDKGNRVQSIMAAYNFLLLEPSSNRSKGGYELLMSQWNKGISTDGEKTINIELSAMEKNEFQAAELSLSLLAASKGIEKNEGKTEAELFAENTDSFFAILGEIKNGNKGFWWDFYVDFYYEMHNQGHVEAFSYYVSMSSENEEVVDWLKSNEAKIEEFSDWYNTYKR